MRQEATLTVAQLKVPGEPVPLERSRSGRNGHHYLPKRSQEFRERLQAAWMVEGRPWLGEGPLELSCVFYVPRAASHLKADGSLRSSAPVWPSRGDLSNLVKACEDALDGLLWADDRQVVRFRDCGKVYAAEEPCTELEVSTVQISAA